MGSARRRLLVTLWLLAAAALLLSVGALAQIDPRNDSPEYFDAINGGQCFEHHLEDGFHPFSFRFKKMYSQLPVDEVVPIEVRIIHDSPFGPHELYDMTVTVDRSQAMNVDIVTEDFPEAIEGSWGPHEVEHGMSLGKTVGDGSNTVFVGPGAYEGALVARIGQVYVQGSPLVGDHDLNGELHLEAKKEGGSTKDVRRSAGFARLPLDEEFFESRGLGNYTFDVTWDAPHAMVSDHMTAEIEMGLWVNFTSDTPEVVFAAPVPFLVGEGSSTSVEVPVRIRSEEPALLDFKIQAMAYYDHDKEDGAPLDEGIYLRFLTMEVEGGDELIVTQNTAGTVPAPVGEVVNLYNMLTRLLGFIGLFLVTMAMFTGGVFGKSSRRWMNKATGGAKKRVLWHSSMGFLIVVVATVHFGLALVESTHDISKGLLWGGLAWALLISLGFTGYYQVRMIRKWNYRVWRHVHLWSALAVLLFVLMHTLLEGSDLKPVRMLLPEGHDRLVWPRP